MGWLFTLFFLKFENAKDFILEFWMFQTWGLNSSKLDAKILKSKQIENELPFYVPK